MSTNNKISNIVSSQVPFFVRNDHENFVRFIEAYYEFLEQDGETLDVLKNIRNYVDIDQSVDIFTQKMYDTFMKVMPEDIKADKKMVLKHIKDFYRAKGTEKAVRFLMNILYGKEVSFYYPRRDVMRLSDAKWYVEKTIRVGDVKIDGVSNNDISGLRKFASTKIRGNTSNATAIVESADIFFENGVTVNSLRLSNEVSNFASGESVFTYFDDDGQTKSISATIFSGIIRDTIVTDGGTGYKVGDPVIVESQTGSGAVIQVGSVTSGRLKSAYVIESGAGFQNNDFLLITGGGGSGANANVLAVSADGYYHPNSYNIITSTISLEANTRIGNTVYTNLNSSNVNVSLVNALSYFVFANTGPVERIRILSGGDFYSSVPNLDIIANTSIRSMGILGRMKIVDGGLGYQIGDVIEFTNKTIDGRTVLGTGAIANVTNVDINGTITKVNFQKVAGHIIGGTGFSNDLLPKANISTSTGTGANVVVTTILGDGETLSGNTDDIGIIQTLSVINRGSGYETPPTLNLSNSGSGTAQAYCTIITGIYRADGRYISDDGIVSGFNFMQDRDYYQNYSYVIRVKESLEKYRKAIKTLAHPAGMRLFGEYTFEDENIPVIANGVVTSGGTTQHSKFILGNYSANLNNVQVNAHQAHGLTRNNTIYLEFTTGDTINITDGIFVVSTSNANTFFVTHPNSAHTSGNVYVGLSL
jgi:hypothetical protein